MLIRKAGYRRARLGRIAAFPNRELPRAAPALAATANLAPVASAAMPMVD